MALFFFRTFFGRIERWPFYNHSVVQKFIRHSTLAHKIGEFGYEKCCMLTLTSTFILHPFCINTYRNKMHINSVHCKLNSQIIATTKTKTNRFLKLTIRNFNRIVTNDPLVCEILIIETKKKLSNFFHTNCGPEWPKTKQNKNTHKQRQVYYDAFLVD